MEGSQKEVTEIIIMKNFMYDDPVSSVASLGSMPLSMFTLSCSLFNVMLE